MHKVRVVQEIINKYAFEELQRPPYRTDLAPSDYCLFSKLKNHLREHRLSSQDDLENAVEPYFAELAKNIF